MTQYTEELHRIREAYRKYAEDGSETQRWSDASPVNTLLVQKRDAAFRRLIASAGVQSMEGRRLFDIGAGSGKNVRFFNEIGIKTRNVTGMDLIPQRVKAAANAHPEGTFFVANAAEIPLPDASVDVVSLFVVLSSILDDTLWHALSREVERILKPGGLVLWYDFRYSNPRNTRVRRVTHDDMEALFPAFKISSVTTLVPPQLLKPFGGLARIAYSLFHLFPFLRSHIVALLQKQGNHGG